MFELSKTFGLFQAVRIVQFLGLLLGRGWLYQDGV